MLAAFLAPAARANGPTDGTIVRVSSGEFIIDIGTDRGLVAGARVQVFRRIEVQHPVTRKTIVDRFPTGIVTVSEAGRLLAIVDDFNALDPTPQVGDSIMVLDPARPTPKPAAPGAPVEPVPPGGPVAPVATKPPTSAPDIVAAFLQASLGKPIDERIALWTTFLLEQPSSPHAPAIREEVATLTALRRQSKECVETVCPEGPAAPRVVKTDKLTAHIAVPTKLLTDQPLEVYVAVYERHEVASMRALVRRPNDQTYVTLAMEPDGRTGFRVALDKSWLAPGNLQLRVEAVRTSGEVNVLTSVSDIRIAITEATRDVVDERDRSRASVRMDWVSFWAKRSDDQFLRIEGDFRYRLDEGALKAFRMGVGNFQGQGGGTERLESGGRGVARTANYGFGEVEFELHPLFGFSARLTAGSYQPLGDNEPLASIFGGSVEARIGQLERTRLYGGLQLTEHIGDEFWLRVAVEEVPDWPMEASVVVTNLPVGADYGVSLTYGIAWQASELIAIGLRVGWNARTINHSGVAAGTQVVLTW